MSVVNPHTINGRQLGGVTPLSVVQSLNDAEFALIRHIDIDFRRRNIVREGLKQLFGCRLALAEDLQQACSTVNTVIKTEPALFEKDMPAHSPRQQGTGFLHLLLD